MSNQMSQMLSMFFLVLLIIFSGEVICYQTTYAKVLNESENIAIHVQQYGTTDFTQYVNTREFFDDCSYSKTSSNGYSVYTIKTTKEYEPFSTIFSFMDSNISCVVYVTRKE